MRERATPNDFLEVRYKGATGGGHTGDTQQWEQAFAACDFEGERMTQIRVYPIDLGHGDGTAKTRTRRGRPIPAEGAMAERILTRVQRLSAKYGTRMEISDRIGVVNI